jgi:hypothetical protein
MTIDTSYFEGDLSIGQITSPAVIASVNLFIQKYEDELLTRLLGYSLYKLYKIWAGENPNPITSSTFNSARFKMGDGGAYTPAVGDSTYTNPNLIGLTIDDFYIFRNGTYFYPTHYTFDTTKGAISLVAPDVWGANGASDEVLIMSKSVMTSVGSLQNEDRFFALRDGREYVWNGETIKWNGLAFDSNGTKRSLIADYVYYQYLKDNVSFTMGAGEVESKADVATSPKLKMIRAWNDMAMMNSELFQFLQANQSVYPEFVSNLYSFNLFGLQKSRINLLKPISFI